MIQLGANSVLFGGYDLETAMKHIAWAGYDGIELSAIKGMCEHLNLDAFREDAPRIKEMAEQLAAPNVIQLYRDYLENFAINRGDVR